jgi:hypothetical protein
MPIVKEQPTTTIKVTTVTPIVAPGPLLNKIILRLAALNIADPALAALVAQYKAATRS